MLIWLDRTPESFVREHPGASHRDAMLPDAGIANILRFHVPSTYVPNSTRSGSRAG